MCGIFSLLNNKTISAEKIQDHFKRGEMRGPEFSELKEINDQLTLGFHRLAINGLNASSNQPMNIDHITLVCNGEIYNYKQLFAYMNIAPKTDSDCEIIIHLYKEFGIDYTLQLLDGVFAFILYDAKKEEVYAARDPYGVRPLYTLFDPTTTFGPTITTTFAFASELKVLSGLFKGKISHVQPGHYIKFDKKNTIFCLASPSIKYNTTCFSPDVLNTNTSQQDVTSIYSKICTTLIHAVKKRVVGTTDRPVACLLSGGLDSSLIAAIVKQFYKGELETYSIGMKGSQDILYAEMVAAHIQSKHTSIIVTEEEFLNAIPEVVKAIESYDTTSVRASVGNYLIGKYISKHSQAKVIFNGDGSDELTGGYLYFQAAPSNLAFDIECKRLLQDIYAFDVLRSDKSISSHGLEPRTPFLDRGWIDYYLSLPVEIRRPKLGQIEKNLLRTAFSIFEPNLLPAEVLWRRKEAFSDGVSGQHKSWYEIITDHVNDKPLMYTNYTKEQSYYRSIFDEAYPDCADIVPYFWMPRFIEATDPSARTLKIYNH